MPFSSGVYAPPSSSFNPAVTNTAINSTDWNSLLSDLNTALSTCVLKDGTQTMTANIPMAGFKLTGLAAGSTNGDSLRYEQVFTTGGIASSLVLRSYLAGLTMSTAGGSGTMSIAAGQATDSTNAALMTLSAISKTTSAWAVGTGNGGLDTGAIANSTLYYFYVIQRTDTGVVDVLFSTSATAPTMPASYTLKRRIGAMRTDGSAHWLAFTQKNDKFLLTTPVQDANGTTGGTTRQTVGTSVPPNMIGLYRISLQDGTNLSSLVVQPVAETDAQASGVASPGLSLSTSVLSQFASGEFEVPVDASSQIALRSGSGTAVYQIVNKGWIDYRGKDS